MWLSSDSPGACHGGADRIRLPVVILHHVLETCDDFTAMSVLLAAYFMRLLYV